MNHRIFGTALLVLALLLTLGTALLFPTCGPMENGTWMKCHWTGQTVIGTGVVLLGIAAFYLFFSEPRLGLSLAAIPVGLLALVIPNGLIGVCGKAEMPCHAITRPAVTILSLAVILLSTVNTVLLWNRYRR